MPLESTKKLNKLNMFEFKRNDKSPILNDSLKDKLCSERKEYDKENNIEIINPKRSSLRLAQSRLNSQKIVNNEWGNVIDLNEQIDSDNSEHIESDNSFDLFIPTTNHENKKKRKVRKNKNRNLSTKFKKNNIKQMEISNSEVDDFEKNEDNETTDSNEWEDVVDDIPVAHNELNFMQPLLDYEKNQMNLVDDESNPAITVRLSINKSGKSVVKKDADKLEMMALSRKIVKNYRIMHTMHVMCLLAYGRHLNRRCDSLMNQALGLSFLHKCNSIWIDTDLLDIDQWTEDHLNNCLLTIISREGFDFQLDNSFDQSHRSINKTDVIVLFIGALRCLGFDVRLMIGLNPISLTPPKNLKSKSKQQASLTKNKLYQTDSNELSSLSGFFVFAEVYLIDKAKWICVDSFSSPNGSIGFLPFRYHQTFLYTIGFGSNRQSSNFYKNRNPLDLTARYDLDWAGHSISLRLPNQKWMDLLNHQKLFANIDASNYGYLNLMDDDHHHREVIERDRLDQDSIRQRWLEQPLPDRMQDFKNHPLYVLRRHLLKFQVIHPPDAIPLGYFRGEPIYSRDCVHLCHTRESWLREAMVVRTHEKAAKIVKSRSTMRNKLLRGTENKPDMVEIFGLWQVDPYDPPVAKNGQVPRNAYGSIDLFKPSMLPRGCVHLCLSGIQYIARKLNIDYAPAVVGWTFHGSGWAHPKVFGCVVCKEFVPKLIGQWKLERMNAKCALEAERVQRALDNWKRLVRGLFLWHRVKAQFALAPLLSAKNCINLDKNQTESSKVTSKKIKKSQKIEDFELDKYDLVEKSRIIGFASSPLINNSNNNNSLGNEQHNTDGWKRLGTGMDSTQLEIKFPNFNVKPKFVQVPRNQYSLRSKKSKKDGLGCEKIVDTSIDIDSEDDFIDSPIRK